MGTIRMKIQALDWTMGDVGSVFVGLKGGSCRIKVISAQPSKATPARLRASIRLRQGARTVR